MWNSANSAIVGFATSSDDFTSLRDVYQGLEINEKCQKMTCCTISLKRADIRFDIIGPYYFTCSSTVEIRFVHSIMTHTVLAFYSVLLWSKSSVV